MRGERTGKDGNLKSEGLGRGRMGGENGERRGKVTKQEGRGRGGREGEGRHCDERGQKVTKWEETRGRVRERGRG